MTRWRGRITAWPSCSCVPEEEAAAHLRRFLELAPEREEAQRHVDHARATLMRLEGADPGGEAGGGGRPEDAVR